MTFASIIAKAEADVEVFIQKVVTEGEALLHEVEAGLSQVANLTPAAAMALEAASGFVALIPGAQAAPGVVAAIEVANEAVQGLNAFATTYKAATAPGGSVKASDATKAVLSGYQGYRKALAAANGVRAAVAAHAQAPGQVKKDAAPVAQATVPNPTAFGGQTAHD